MHESRNPLNAKAIGVPKGLKQFTAEDYALPFFKEEGFVRKHCPKCGEYYWTQNPEQETCGESSSDECGYYTFINNPATKKKL